jgi:uncharacterized damage-inducible protein DinB
MKDFFRELFVYNHHSNTEVLQGILENEALYSGKVEKLVSHTLNAHHIWNARVQGEEATFGVWQNHALKEAFELDRANFEVSNEVLERTNLQQEISYTNSKGITFQNKVQDVLFHIINHSTYHRGQLMSELKKVDFSPISTDYIRYKR